MFVSACELVRIRVRYFPLKWGWPDSVLRVPTEGEGEGGGAALSVCPQKVSTRRLQRWPQDIQGTQSIDLPQPVPMSEENERKSAEDQQRSQQRSRSQRWTKSGLISTFFPPTWPTMLLAIFSHVFCMCLVLFILPRTLGWLRNSLQRQLNWNRNPMKRTMPERVPSVAAGTRL